MKPNNYHHQYEIIFYGFKPKGGGLKHWFSGRTEDEASDVWKIKRDPSSSYLHPTQKPVELAEKAHELDTVNMWPNENFPLAIHYIIAKDYDKTIYYNDYSVSNALQLVKRSSKPWIFIYFSDISFKIQSICWICKNISHPFAFHTYKTIFA